MFQFPQSTGGAPKGSREGRDRSGCRWDLEGLLPCQGWGGKVGGSVQPWGEVVRTVARAVGSAQKAPGLAAAPGSPGCSREIGQQEAAVGNPSAGNSRCCLPNTAWACVTPSPAVSPRSG